MDSLMLKCESVIESLRTNLMSCDADFQKRLNSFKEEILEDRKTLNL